VSGTRRPTGSTAARPARASGLRPPTLLWLTLVWVAMWGDLSLFNVLAGLLIAVVVCLVFPLPSLRMHLRVRPLRLAWLVLRFVVDVVRASIHVSWTTLQFNRQPLNAVIEVDLRTPSDFVLTLVAEMTSLVPGSLVVEARRSTHTLYLHVLDARDQAGVDQMRRDVLALERRVVLAFGTETDHLERPPAAPAATNSPEKESP
jgi:multicomponent Na+:H+ antiporter subunit E